MTKKRKKSLLRSRFYQVYFALVALAVVAIAVGTAWLRNVLADYESAQPVHVAREVARLFETADYGAIYEVDTSAAQIAEGDRDFYVSSLSALNAGKAVAWSEAFSADEDERRYAVSVDGERFATFTLVPSGETTARGNRLWTLGSVTTNVELRQPEPEPEPEEIQTWQCRITAPKGYAVSVDGVTLSGENANVSEKALFEDGFLPAGVSNPVLVEYVYDATSQMPAIAAVDEAGAEAEVVAYGDRPFTWDVEWREDAALREQYGDAALALGKQVAKYISGDAGKKSIQRICADKSPADEIFDNLGNRYTTPHDGVKVRNEEASEFYSLSEDCFTCHVAFDFVLNTKNGEKVYPTAYTFCVIRQGGEGKLYNLLIY